ncbi:tetratricopeptide repeat protein, partial [Micromonospora chalcea]
MDVPGHDGVLPKMPPYVSRGHDARLREAVQSAANGRSEFVVLVGGSSTGKTRACWEAIQVLDERWQLWHPIDPSRPEAAARAVADVGPRTVVWLNEAQHYLLTADPGVGERIAAGLRTLLADPARGPVLVLATLWPEYWTTLTAAPKVEKPDQYAQARQLLSGADMRVPEAFTAAELRALADAATGDVRLRHAVRHAADGRVTQHLAGVPELSARYRNAFPAARAVIDVAIDARRIGYSVQIPHSLLEQAAPGYLTDLEWQQAGEGWLERALDYTEEPCHGVRGPLTRIRARPGDLANSSGEPRYRLADYLEQSGRAERAAAFPPDSFWIATAKTVSDPDLLRRLADHARKRGRYQHAVNLYRMAVAHGDSRSLMYLARFRVSNGDRDAAAALLQQAADHGDTDVLRLMALAAERLGDSASAEAIATQAADYGNTQVLRELAFQHSMTFDRARAVALYRQAAERGDKGALRDLSHLRQQAGDADGAEMLALEA